MVSLCECLLGLFRRKRRRLSTPAGGNINKNGNSQVNSNQLSVPPASTRPPSSYEVINGLRELYAPDNAVVDIVFLHGLNGRSDATFTHREAGVF
ncbi:hypothetical protein F5B19DRAFT_479725 [Rostrohypoxylon terebratum]|nr:hypothetical protein F5B19DRAFT_479725 [Rostrohypoxylon terebratum]